MQKGFQTVDLLNFHGCASGTIATPIIGENGNWWIGNDDTGVKAGTTSGLDQKLADLEAKYELMNSDLEWKLAGTVTGKVSITLPVKIRELCVIVLNDNEHISVIIPADILTDHQKNFSWGAPAALYGGIRYVEALIAVDSYNLTLAVSSSVETSNIAVSYVYYR